MPLNISIPTVQDQQAVRVARMNFGDAGVDNFSEPPSQDPVMMEELTNVMPIVSGSCERRWGYRLWANPGILPATHLYEYLNNEADVKKILLTAQTYMRAYNEDGTSFNPSIFTPSFTTEAMRAAISRDFAYFTNGLDYKKWDGSVGGGVTNWGIAKETVSGATAIGPQTATVISQNGTDSSFTNQGPLGSTIVTNTAFGGVAWTPANLDLAEDLGALDGAYDFVEGTGAYTSDYLTIMGFAFAIPVDAIVTGISATFYREQAPSTTITDNSIRIVKAGTITGTDHSAAAVWGISFATPVTFGGTGDLWGETWTPAEINASDFGVAIAAANSGGTANAYIDYASITVTYTTTGTFSWTDLDNARVLDGAVAVATPTAPNHSFNILLTGYGFTFAPGLISSGITVLLTAFESTGPVDIYLGLLKAGVLASSVKIQNIDVTASNTYTLGGATDLWDATWTADDINDPDFGIILYAIPVSGSAIISIDSVRITVNMRSVPVTLDAPVAGSITLIQGRTYFTVFNNSTTGHFGELSSASENTGPLTAQDQPLSDISESPDSQVDRVYILATADGGDETRLFVVGSVVNGTTTFTDNVAEIDLLEQPVFLSTDEFGFEFGVVGNSPPPVGGLLPIQHRGRLYLTDGENLFWSKNLTELTTDTGFITGKWEEAWNPLSQLDISKGPERISALLSDGFNIYLGSQYSVRKMEGDPPFIQPPAVVHNHAGVLNQDVWQIVFVENAPVGALWLTPDNRVLLSDFNSFADVGVSIQTTLDSINPDVPEVPHAAFYSNGPFDLYILSIPTGANTSCDTVCIYNMRSRKWVIWELTDALVATLFTILDSGVSQFLLSTEGGKIYALDSTTYLDRTGDTSPVDYTVTAATSWLDLSDPTLRKMLNEIEVLTNDPALTVTVEGASQPSDFTSPHSVISGSTVVTAPLGGYKTFLAASSSHDRYFRFTFAAESQVASFLSGYNIEVLPITRQ